MGKINCLHGKLREKVRQRKFRSCRDAINRVKGHLQGIFLTRHYKYCIDEELDGFVARNVNNPEDVVMICPVGGKLICK